MNYTVAISLQAENDLRSIFEYITWELQSPEYAAGQLSRLEKAIMALDSFPETGRLYEKELWKSRGLRIKPVDNFCMYYVPDKQKKTVTVIRVMYKGRDAKEQLQGD